MPISIPGAQHVQALNEWIQQIIDASPSQLNRRFSGRNAGGPVRELEDALSTLEDEYGSYMMVDESLLRGLHARLKGLKCELIIWRRLVFRLANPLPDAVANDLIDREIALTELGHTRQSDAVQWRLSFLVDEALLTLFKEFYADPARSLDDVQNILAHHTDHVWLVESWKYCFDAASSTEKELAFHHWGWTHPHRPEGFPTTEQHLELMDARVRRAQEDALREAEVRLAASREAAERQALLEHVAAAALGDTEIQSVLSNADPELLLALAGNSKIAAEWIAKLVNCHSVKGARQIRAAAEGNLASRS